MQKVHLLLVLAATVLLCGCDRQTQVNTQKIDVLTQKIFILQQAQSKQLDAIQSQLAALPPVLDKLEKKYFTESQDKALFYHTNALYFLVTIDKRIQAQFDQAAAARKTSDQLAYFYHTNQTDTAYFCASQIADAITAQEKQIEDNINKTVQEANSALSNNFTAQIKTLAADKAQLQAEVAKRAEMEAKLNQIQTELDQIKALLQKINQPQPGPPATQP